MVYRHLEAQRLDLPESDFLDSNIVYGFCRIQSTEAPFPKISGFGRRAGRRFKTSVFIDAFHVFALEK